MKINLISDTVTKPSPEMLSAMMQAEVGDDVFKSDPTVNALEEKAARMFGKEAAIFCPSGTMTNQIAVKVHTQPGDVVIADKFSHVYNYEGGGIAFNSGATCKLIDGEHGRFTAKQAALAIPPNDVHWPQPSLVVVENTTNKGGGACWDFDELVKIKQLCENHKMAYHLDGARLFNAIVVKKETPEQYGKLFDTLSICLSKGLGAPVGSLLLGSQEHIQKAFKYRKIFGGAMRQSGYLAAAGIYALDNNIERLAYDHSRAQEIVEILKALPYVSIIEPVETNIIIFYIPDDVDEDQFINKMEELDILLVGMGDRKLRMVTHLDFTDDMLTELRKRLMSVKF
ncbi:MAG: DegT/DnrJ/EryC1/StrS family aminotransferase [Bacteroidales bacterium]|nr:DegT/DnrJ/EryC1/StrS family aminotransferase [Bacteroidales bacterium]MCF8456265.1 DegT/DnrJ/EryC1/StrS family aminotransferase [Bacteroidales bacterium]